MAAGLNKRRMIQSAVFKELVKVRGHLLTFCTASCVTAVWLFGCLDFFGYAYNHL